MLPIVDTHQHLWDLEKFELPWTAGEEKLGKSHVMREYLAATHEAKVAKAVYMEVDVEPGQRLAEVEYISAICARDDNPTCGAVVSGDPDADDFLAYLDHFKDDPYIKGVRRVLHVPEKAPGTCLSAAFVKGVQSLGERGLSFDICMRPSELADAVSLVDRCPETQFIVDHCGNAVPGVIAGADPGPQTEGGLFWHTRDQWQRDMTALAARPNVVCKISGIVARAEVGVWSAANLAPTINFCLDAFGPDRVVFGGDWPVCTLVASYQEWATALREIIKDRSQDEQRKLLHDNAVKLYNLT